MVFGRAGAVFATSRDVAAFFRKQHKDVLRDIRNLIAKEPSLALRNFAPFKIKDLTGESTGHYEMDRDGFTLLAMSFTGAKALKWKLKYIEAFDTMEAELRARVAPQGVVSIDFHDPNTLRRLSLEITEHIAALRIGKTVPAAAPTGVFSDEHI